MEGSRGAGLSGIGLVLKIKGKGEGATRTFYIRNVLFKV